MLHSNRPTSSTSLRGRALAGLVLLPLALSGVLAGCGDDGSKGNAQSTTPSSAATSPTSPSGAGPEVDRAFVRQMVPHHLMAVEMAKIAVKRAEHAELKTLAKAIVKEQTKEIKTLTRFATALDVEPGSGSGETAMSKDAVTLGTTMDQMGMSMDLELLKKAKHFDARFIEQMTDHHYGAIAMANGEILRGERRAIKALATQISSAQTREVAQMVAWKGRW